MKSSECDGHTHTCTHSHTHTHVHTLTHTHTYTHAHTLTLTHTCTQVRHIPTDEVMVLKLNKRMTGIKKMKEVELLKKLYHPNILQ